MATCPAGPAALLMPSEEQRGAQRENRGAQREGEWLPWIHALREQGDDGYKTTGWGGAHHAPALRGAASSSLELVSSPFIFRKDWRRQHLNFFNKQAAKEH